MKFINPLAAAAVWAERMSNPEAVKQREKRESEQRRAQEAQQPPVPEVDASSEAAPAPAAPKTEKQPRKIGAEFRSALWAGCIMVGVICSIVAFFIGMIR